MSETSRDLQDWPLLDGEPAEVGDRPEAVIYDLDAARQRLERGRRRRVRAGSDGRLIFRL